MSYYLNALRMRPHVEHAVKSLPDNEALEVVKMFEKWNGKGIRYDAGYRVSDDGVLYKCKEPGHTSQPDWKPALTPALWERIEVEHQGTIDDPIPAAIGLRYFKDKYYKEENKVYLCVRDDTGSGTVLYYMPSQLIGIYFEEVSN